MDLPGNLTPPSGYPAKYFLGYGVFFSGDLGYTFIGWFVERGAYETVVQSGLFCLDRPPTFLGRNVGLFQT
jgi:hypothetical protein